MKKLFTFCFLLACGICLGQGPNDSFLISHKIGFDKTSDNHFPLPVGVHVGRMWRDTLSNPNNIWQIGRAQKKDLDTAFSPFNILVTDTVNSYPVNDTSAFIIALRGNGDIGGALGISAYYKVSSDSLHDYGLIEVSVDSGRNWINVMTDTVYKNYYKWIDLKPVFTGSANYWKRFWVDFGGLPRILPVSNYFDLFIRISFISDGKYDTLSGLAFDNFATYSVYEGIPQIQNNALLSLYPNPVSDLLYIERKGAVSKGHLQILDGLGRVIFEDQNFTAPFVSTKAMSLPAGLYFLRFTSGDTYAVQKFLLAP